MKSQAFVVDASLLRELGERLIGRAHIALAELIKNAYDADATYCQIAFDENQIIILDNGTGMSEEDFLNHWMRIGTTHKVEERVSDQLHRPLTGSKGIGRLSVQFLADELILESVTERQPTISLYAYVDWRHAISGGDLNSVNVLWDIPPAVQAGFGDQRSGTRITLKSLKNAWNTTTIGDLGNDVWMLRSPFRQSEHTRQVRTRENFEVQIDAPGIANAREAFNESIHNVFLNWRARIRGSLDRGRFGGKANITVEFKAGYPEKLEKETRFQEIVDVPILRTTRPETTLTQPLLDKVQFEILIFKPEGIQPGGIPVAKLREYLATYGNVSVYDAGFRLPYYGSAGNLAGHDWLSIALDQGRRLNSSELLPAHLRNQERYMQDLPAPGRIFGAVDIDTNHERLAAQQDKEYRSEFLQIQPGRDRLHSNSAFDQLRNLVRLSLDLYANRFRTLSFDTIERARAREPPSRKFGRVLNILDANKASIPAEILREVRHEVVDAQRATAAEERAQDQRAALLAPLAAAGMTALALNHEIAREVRMLDRVSTKLRQIASEHSLPELVGLADQFAEAKARLDSLQELFSPLLSDIDTSATDRLRVRVVVDQVIRAMRVLMPRVIFRVASIPTSLRFPMGSLAEWNAMLQNILANAWNAMLDSKEAIISFEGSPQGARREWLRISDTGKGLDIPVSDAAQLFEPFERRLVISADKRSIAIGGQGLGLTIVRMIAHRRSIEVAFVEPEREFSTSLEMSWRAAAK